MRVEIRKDKYINLTRKERQALYDLKNEKNIFIKGVIRGLQQSSGREDYIKKVEKQLGNSDVCEEVADDPEPLISTIHKAIEKIRKRDLKKETNKYFEVK